MKTKPWFSTERLDDDDEQPVVHHDNTACKLGKGIHKNHRRYGTDNRPLCAKCAQLDATGR